jgi:hypothetical protein
MLPNFGSVFGKIVKLRGELCDVRRRKAREDFYFVFSGKD